MQIGNRMKMYEGIETERKLIPLLPVCIRVDGRAFSSLTKGLEKPYDKRFTDLMVEVTKYIVSETNARIGYTQSDEISLVLYSDDIKSQIFFDGRIFKICSTVSAIVSVKFNELLLDYLPEKAAQIPTFDCRVWNVPTLYEATNTVLWREIDATRNSILCAGQKYYSHKQLDNKNTGEIQELLFQKGVNWNNYPAFYKRGTYIQRRKVIRKFTVDEIEKLPLKHEARNNPDLMVERHDIVILEMPPISTIINRDGVIFFGEDPQIVEQ